MGDICTNCINSTFCENPAMHAHSNFNVHFPERDVSNFMLKCNVIQTHYLLSTSLRVARLHFALGQKLADQLNLLAATSASTRY
jgi:hypothetical protein